MIPANVESKIDRTGDCWLWTGAQMRNGYGHVWVDGRCKAAHRVVYEALVEPILEGMELDHVCRVRRCVNPAHLEVVTHAENLTRGEGFIGRQSRQTHCKRGHPLSGSNLYRWKNKRQCRACRSAAMRRFHANAALS